MRKWGIYILIAICLIALVLQIFAARSDSQTTDEAIHLVAGYTYLTKGDFRLDPEHPPLIKELDALPLLLTNINTDFGATWDKAGNFYYDSWQEARTLGDRFLYDWGNNASQILFLGRIVPIILTLFLVLFAYFWAKKLYGEKAGIIAAFLTLFFPNILAHGHLINTDIGITLFALIAIYFWGEFLKTKSWSSLILTGLFSGLMLASKYTAVIFVLVMIVLLIIKIIIDKRDVLKMIGAFLLTMIISFVVIWATYGFKILVPPVPLGNFVAEISRWSGYGGLPNSLNHVYDSIRPLLLPSYYYKGFVMVGRHAVGGHGSFLLGMHSNTGWWYYFPVAILVKTPLAIFAGLYFAIRYFKKIKAKISFDEFLLIVPIVVYLIVSMSSQANLGVRHILPIFPFLFIFIAKAINLVDFKKFWPTLICGILVLWYLLTAIFAYPNYIAYFNELVGGSRNGHKILTDSNLDWGQDVYRIKQYLVDNNIDHVYLVYPWNGDNVLNYYGINFTPLTPDDRDVSGPAVISATYYETDAYAWLKQYPMKEITAGVFLVDINN